MLNSDQPIMIDSDVDVVLLATPPCFRPQHLEAAVNANKHIFCEKPFAVDAPGLRRVMEAAKKAKAKNWPVVMKAVSEIHYQGGWLTAEVPGGDRNHLKQISTQMDEIIMIKTSII